MDYGFWSIVPPILTIILAIVTKEILVSLFIGVYLGCLLLVDWNPISSVFKFIEILAGTYGDDDAVVSGVITDPADAEIFIIIILLGGLVGLLVRSGGSQAFGELVSKKVKTQKGAQLITWVIGMCIFFDDYFNALTNGSVMRPVTDRFNVSREKISYIVDSTAAGICVISPISSYIAFVSGLIVAAYGVAGIEGNPYGEFLKTIPYNYYSWLALLMVFFIIILKIDFGPMAKAEKRARETGQVCEKTFSGGEADEDDFAAIEPAKGKVWILLVPVFMLIILTVLLMVYTGGGFSGASMVDILNNMDGTLSLTCAIAITVVFTMILLSVTRLSKMLETMQAFIIGAKSIMYVLLMLALAWAIGSICDEMGTAAYVVDAIGKSIPASVIPLIIFLVACGLTFATGAEWGVWAIMMPLVVPLAVNTGVNPVIAMSAVLGGGLFGGHCSPLSDMIVLSSASCNIRPIDHVKTQVPYSVTCASCAAVGYIVSGFMDNWYIPMLVTFGAFFVAVFILKNLFGEKKQKLDNMPDPDAAV